MSPTTPIVFVIDDDVSARESLESLIRFAGSQPETYGSARDFLACRGRMRLWRSFANLHQRPEGVVTLPCWE
jgi:hypothetical protein